MTNAIQEVVSASVEDAQKPVTGHQELPPHLITLGLMAVYLDMPPEAVRELLTDEPAAELHFGAPEDLPEPVWGWTALAGLERTLRRDIPDERAINYRDMPHSVRAPLGVLTAAQAVQRTLVPELRLTELPQPGAPAPIQPTAAPERTIQVYEDPLDPSLWVDVHAVTEGLRCTRAALRWILTQVHPNEVDFEMAADGRRAGYTAETHALLREQILRSNRTNGQLDEWLNHGRVVQRIEDAREKAGQPPIAEGQIWSVLMSMNIRPGQWRVKLPSSGGAAVNKIGSHRYDARYSPMVADKVINACLAL